MKEFNGFSYICPNCNHYDFVCADGVPTQNFTCLHCGEKLPLTSHIIHLNIEDLIKEGLVIPMAQKVRKWKRLETEPQEIDIISEAYQMQCPFCKAYDQKFISYSKEPFRAGVLCTTCSTIYFAEFVDPIECDISADKLAEVINKINTDLVQENGYTVIKVLINELSEALLVSNSYFDKKTFEDACYKVVKEGEVNGNK